jgi:hypothetical protein
MNLNILKLRFETEDSRSTVAHTGIILLINVTSHAVKIRKINIFWTSK